MRKPEIEVKKLILIEQGGQKYWTDSFTDNEGMLEFDTRTRNGEVNHHLIPKKDASIHTGLNAPSDFGKVNIDASEEEA